MNRIASVTVAGLCLLAPRLALAAAEHVGISGPAHVAVSHALRVTVSGDASSGRRLGVFRDMRTCANRLEDEFAHPGSTELLEAPVSGQFDHKLTVRNSPHGTDHICAYIYHRLYDNALTDARARFKYVDG